MKPKKHWVRPFLAPWWLAVFVISGCEAEVECELGPDDLATGIDLVIASSELNGNPSRAAIGAAVSISVWLITDGCDGSIQERAEGLLDDWRYRNDPHLCGSDDCTKLALIGLSGIKRPHLEAPEKDHIEEFCRRRPNECRKLKGELLPRLKGGKSLRASDKEWFTELYKETSQSDDRRQMGAINGAALVAVASLSDSAWSDHHLGWCKSIGPIFYANPIFTGIDITEMESCPSNIKYTGEPIDFGEDIEFEDYP